MNDDFSLLRYTIELTFIKKLNDCLWWQFGKRRAIYKWREKKMSELNH